jgi:hypothetical protein
MNCATSLFANNVALLALTACEADTAADEDNASEAVVAVPVNGPINSVDVIRDDTNAIFLSLYYTSKYPADCQTVPFHFSTASLDADSIKRQAPIVNDPVMI